MMSSKNEKSEKMFSSKRHQSVIQNETVEEQPNVAIVYASLMDIPLTERRKEAEKPLYLKRC